MKEKFESKFRSAVQQCVGGPIKTKNDPQYKLIAEMLEWLFGFTQDQINSLILGKQFYFYNGAKKYRIGGINGDNAVHIVYASCIFFLETDWWPMGLDKASVWLPSGVEPKSYVQPKDSTPYSREYTIYYYETPNTAMMVACTGDEVLNTPNWHYSAILIKPDAIFDFVEAFEVNGNFECFGIEFSVEEVEFIGSGYSATDIKLLAWTHSMQ